MRRYLAALISASLIGAGCSSQAASAPVVYADHDPSPQVFVSGLYKAAQHSFEAQGRIRAVIVPHHLTATETIASGIEALRGQMYKTKTY